MATNKKNQQFVAINGVQRLMVARKDNGRMAAIALNDDCHCIYSPVKGLELVDGLQGKVTDILAPNHYHNKGLASFSALHSGASVCASRSATVRLKSQTGIAIKPLTRLRRKLPAGFDLIEPEGLKTGEVWVRFPVGRGVGWLVADSFSAKKMTAASSASTVSATPTLLGTFPSYAVGDGERYVDWVLQMIKQDKPQLVIPCHGHVVKAAGLPAKLAGLVETLR